MRVYILLLLTSLLLVQLSHVQAETLPLSERHSSVSGNELLPQVSSYEAYIVQMTDRIKTSRLDLGATEVSDRDIVALNAPFIMEPPASCASNVSGELRSKQKQYRKGVVITHGLTDSPGQIRDLALEFQARCFLVYGLLLPGHGTRPGDMLAVSASEWEKSEVFALDLMKQRVEQVYLAGFSMGGALALSAAAGDEEINGVILMSPALKLTPLASIAWVHRLVSWAFPRAKWLDVLPDDDPFRYQSFSLNAVAQVDKVVDRMRERVRLLGVSAPVYIAASWEDRTVDMPGGFAFIGQHIPAYVGRLYYQSGAQTKADLLASRGLASAVDAGRLELVDSTALDPAVLGFSHLSVQLSPANRYYGKEGRLRSCHYYFHADFAGYQQCKRGLADFQGELNRKTLERGLIQRLSYNPDWDGMWQSIDRFLVQADLGSLK